MTTLNAQFSQLQNCLTLAENQRPDSQTILRQS